MGLTLNLGLRSSTQGAWWPEGASYAADFANNRYMAAKVPVRAEEAFTFARSTTKMAPDQNGIYRLFGLNSPVISDKGILLEPAATNAIPNTTMQGAAAGSPGLTPTGWSAPNSQHGLTRQITGIGTDRGVDYIDIRYSGLTTQTGLISPLFLASNQIPVSTGQFWTHSTFVALAGGTLANLTSLTLRLAQFSAANTYLADFDNGSGVPVALSLLGAAAGLTRMSLTGRANHASVVYGTAHWQFGYNSGAMLDFTVRLGWPQMELGALRTSPIPTSVTTGTRAADVLNLLLPAGSHDLTIAFDDASFQTIASATGTCLIPTNPGKRALTIIGTPHI